MSETKHEFSIKGGSKDCASKNDANFSTKLASLLENGGDDLASWFTTSQAALHKISSTISMSGQTVWLKGEDSNGFPIFYVVEGNDMLMIGAYFTDKGKQVLANGSLSADESEEIGFSYMTLVLQHKQPDESLHQIGVYSLEYAGSGVADIEVGEGFKTFIENIAQVIKEFVAEMFVMAFEVEGTVEGAAIQQQMVDNAGEAADATKVEDATITIGDQEVVADIAISSSEALGLVFGLGELALSLALTIMAKKIVTYARVYNLSDTPFELMVCHIEPGAALVSAPMLALTKMNVPALGPSWTPAAFLGENPAHYIDMIFSNTDNLEGVGYVLKAYAHGDFPGFNALVSAPHKGDNSVYVSFTEMDQCNNYWLQNNDKQKSLTFSTSSGKYVLQIAASKLSGESPSPTDGQLGYYFEHLIVLKNA